jgi:toxin ParE1/3/4
MSFSIRIDRRAVEDIQQSVDYYEEKQPGLGRLFEQELNRQINKLKTSPFFQVRYDKVRCIPLHTFSHMIHFTVDETKNIVSVRAVFHTSRDSEMWTRRTD